MRRACPSHQKYPISDGIIFVCHLALCVRGFKRLKRFWPYLMAFRSCISTGKPEYIIAGFQYHANENKNQNHSIDKVQNLGNERRYIYKDLRQDSGQRNISYTRYPKKCFTQIYRDLYGDAMLVLTWMSSNMADGNQQKHLLPSFATKA